MSRNSNIRELVDAILKLAALAAISGLIGTAAIRSLSCAPTAFSTYSGLLAIIAAFIVYLIGVFHFSATVLEIVGTSERALRISQVLSWALYAVAMCLVAASIVVLVPVVMDGLPNCETATISKDRADEGGLSQAEPFLLGIAAMSTG
ncbi:hypothetical protein [Pseudoroseicyclus sp. CXY001]|uniref:hypothetical protein n=1 Tax=Pseudoroseicyclus sp. CXY001 TaxID=3242492 RepID=UPI003570FD69